MGDQDIELMAHLMRRAGFGAPRDELERRAARGYEATVEDLLNPGEAEYLPDDVIRRFHVDMHETRQLASTAGLWVYRLVTSANPLEEKIALFWHGIFAAGYSKVRQGRSISNQIDMFRRYGLGRLDNLLVELSRDPAMIIWLDNDTNHNGAINENYGRELLELFSMGIGNYAENDIKECARAFTGWTLGNSEYMAMRVANDSEAPYGRIAWHFDYRDWDHDDGEKTFLGEKGQFNGEDIVQIIARQPATAHFVARHIYDFFVADEAPVPQWADTPPVDPNAIEIMANAYTESDHDIRSVLRATFNSDFFKEAMFARVKCPVELVAGTMRLSGGVGRPNPSIIDAGMVASYMGQGLYDPPSVEGWHEGTEWINSGALMERVNFAAKQMSDVDKPGVRAIIDRLAAKDGGTFSPEELLDSCLDLMGPIKLYDEASRTALVEHVARQGDLSLKGHRHGDEAENRVARLLGLIASTREYQLA